MALVDKRQSVLPRREIERRIAKGQKILLHDGRVLLADAWLRFHPGGEKAILHMVGRDATDEIYALHSPEARNRMLKFQIGQYERPWRNFVPPIQGGRFKLHECPEKKIDELGVQDENEDSDTSDTSDRSSLFDRQDNSLIRRKHHEQTDTSSVSSAGSSSKPVSQGSKKELSHLDVFTQEAIDLDLAKYPPLDAPTQSHIQERYRELYQRLQKDNLFTCSYSEYFKESCRYAALFTGFLLCLHTGWYSLSGAFLGLLWHQLVFTVHDAGHMGITHGYQTDTIIGIMIADFIGGVSLCWWKQNHNVHHIVTNSPEHDPDIEHMPIFAVSHRFFDSLKSTYYDRVMTYDAFAKYIVQFQHFLYYPVLLFGRFNLYRLSWEYLILGKGPKKGPARWHRSLEIVGQIFFWYWYGYLVVYKTIPPGISRWSFVLISHMLTAPLHVQITLSHFAMSTADHGAGESFPQKMLRTTMDVDCPAWLDFIHGGLQFQAIHHLFPRMPRHNLRRAQKYVQEFCREVDIPYALYGFVKGNQQVIGRLAEVGRQAAIYAECQKAVVEHRCHSHE